MSLADRNRAGLAFLLSLAMTLALAPAGSEAGNAFLPSVVNSSTVPADGDLNPYGVAIVPPGFPGGGAIKPGDILVSNFNNSKNLQGTGTTIVRVTPSGQSSVFYQGPPGVGLTTALGVLQAGYVLVGAVPSTDGTSATGLIPGRSGTRWVIGRCDASRAGETARRPDAAKDVKVKVDGIWAKISRMRRASLLSPIATT